VSTALRERLVGRWTTRARSTRRLVLVARRLVEALGDGARAGCGRRRVDLAARSSRPASSTRTTTSTRRSRAPARSRRRCSSGSRALPVWARLDAEAEYAAARTGLAELALSGCTTVFDHHYVFPRGDAGSSRRRCRPPASSACASSPRAARWTSASDGGLPPDALVEDIDAVLADTERSRRAARARPARACRSRSRRARRSPSRGG
jgi:hypothetical protein